MPKAKTPPETVQYVTGLLAGCWQTLDQLGAEVIADMDQATKENFRQAASEVTELLGEFLEKI